MPMTGAQLRTQLADTTRNRRDVVAGSVASGGKVITMRFRFAGVAFIPETFYDALVTLYGAGKVSTDLDNTGRSASDLQFTIIP